MVGGRGWAGGPSVSLKHTVDISTGYWQAPKYSGYDTALSTLINVDSKV